MLHQLDSALERMLRDRLQLDRSALDIAFDTPDIDWGSRLTKPTLNMFLWDIRRSAEEARAGRERVVQDGREVWRQTLPRIEFQYLLTAWTSEVADEHELLGRSLVAALGCDALEGDHRPEFTSESDPPPTVRVARADGKDLAEFWGAIEGKLKPGLNLVVTASIDPGIGIPAGPPTERYDVRISDVREPARQSVRRRVGGHSDAIGAAVRSPRGSTVVGPDGTFLVDAEAGDEIVVEAPEPVVIVVPQLEGHGST